MKKLLPACLLLVLLLSACGGGSADTPQPTPDPTPVATPTPEPTPTPYDGPENPLTGMPIDAELVNRRPIAIMLNNIKAALPQLGVSQADVIYEVLAEGGITRMLGLYQSTDGLGTIGSVRSSRTYYLELALGHDAIYLHAGGSEDAYQKIKAWNVTALDCVRGPYEGKNPESNLFWRDPERRKTMSLEHTVVTTGQAIATYLPERIEREHEAGYTYTMSFADDGTPAGGEAANVISVPFSSYKTGVFTYIPEQGRYLVEEYGKPYVDGNTGEQVGVTNVITIRTSCSVIPGDDKGRLAVDLTSGGDGWFACGGKIIPIQWSKADRNSQFVYTDGSGNPITLGRGNTYVNIIPTKNEITVS